MSSIKRRKKREEEEAETERMIEMNKHKRKAQYKRKYIFFGAKEKRMG